MTPHSSRCCVPLQTRSAVRRPPGLSTLTKTLRTFVACHSLACHRPVDSCPRLWPCRCCCDSRTFVPGLEYGDCRRRHRAVSVEAYHRLRRRSTSLSAQQLIDTEEWDSTQPTIDEESSIACHSSQPSASEVSDSEAMDHLSFSTWRSCFLHASRLSPRIEC